MQDRRTVKSPKFQLWVILSIVFFGFLGLSIPYLIFPSIFLNPAYTILPPTWSEAERGMFLGITLAAYPLGQFIGSPILGSLSDEYGRRKVMTISLLIAAFCSLLTAFSLVGKLLWLLITSRFFAGLMEGNLAIARAMATDIKEISKRSTFGKITAVSCISYILGPLLGTFLSDKSIHKGLSLSTPFFIISLLSLGIAVLSYFSITNRQKSALVEHRTCAQRINFIVRIKILFKNRLLRLLIIVVSLHTLAADIFYEFSPVLLISKWALEPTKLALYNVVLSATLAIGSGYLASRLATRCPDRTVLKWTMAFFAMCLLAIVLTPSQGIMLTIFGVIGFMIAIPITNLTVQVSDSASDDIQGEIMGILSSLRVLGDAAICLLGGALLSLSPSLILLLAATVSVFSLVYYLRGIRLTFLSEE